MNKWLLGLVIGAVASGFVMTTSACANADQSSNGARFSVVQGTVSVRGANGAQTATANMPLSKGDYVSSGPQARAEVDLNGATMLRLGGSVQAHLIDDGQVQLADGTVEVAVLHPGYGTTQIDTPSVTVRASDKGSYRVSIVSGGGTQVTARTGQVDVVTPQHTYVVSAGKSIVASGTASNPTVVDATAVAYDSFDQFGAQRDQVIASNAPSYQGGYNNGYNATGYGGGYYGGYYGGVYAPYGGYYGYGYPVAAIPACGFGITIGWGGFYGGCSIYPAIGFYNPWWYGYGLAYGGWGWGGYWGGWGWGGYYPGYAYNYGGCCYNGGGYYRPPVYYNHRIYRGPVNRGTLRDGVASNNPVRTTPQGGSRATIARTETQQPVRTENRSAIARNASARSVSERNAAARQVARSAAPIRRDAPTRAAGNDPWSRFDANRGTNVASRAPVATRDQTATRIDRNANTERNAPGNERNMSSSDPWSRFNAVRGNVAMRPDPGTRGSFGGGNPYRGNEYGGNGYGGYGGYNGDRGYSSYPGTGSRSGGDTRGSAPSAPSRSGGGSSGGGGSRGGGGGRPPR